MIAQAVKGTALVFLAAILQVSIFNRLSILDGGPNLALVVLVCLALVGGAAFAACLGFFGGLVVDTATLGTLGVTSLLLTVVGHWAGRYGETTGRDKPHAAFAAVAAATLLYAASALGLRFVLGEQVDGGSLARSLPASLGCNLALTPLLFAVCRRVAARRETLEGAPEVRLLG